MPVIRSIVTSSLILAGLGWLLTAAPVAAEPSVLVDEAWLAERLGRAEVRIVDMSSDGRAYRRAHIPGAVYLSVDDIRAEVKSGGYRLPTPEEATRIFGRLGLEPETTVVAYDDVNGLNAARLFFTLEALGHERVAILDGGISHWRATGRPLNAESPSVRPTSYVARSKPARVGDADWIKARLGHPDVALVDSRSAAEYKGRDVRARRGGHIPGAVNIEWTENLRPDGTFRPVPELRSLYVARGVTPDKTVVTYCQTHHRAAHTYFVLRLLGYPKVVGYDRSWAEWGDREDLPIEK